MSKTQKDLMDAFAGESQANRRYLAFAQRAEDESLSGIAKLFRAVAEAETIHAIKHLRTAGKVKTTKENIEDAIAGETHEFSEMYPEMIANARAEAVKAAEVGFHYANEVEKVHAQLFKKALADPAQFPVQDYWLCKVCGYTAEKEPPDACPVCGANKKAFFKV